MQKNKKKKIIEDPFFVEDLSKFEYRTYPFVDGRDSVKHLFSKLKSEHSSLFLKESKRYFIFDHGFESVDHALRSLPLYDLQKVRNKTVGCLIVKQASVVFFWKKSFDKPKS